MSRETEQEPGATGEFRSFFTSSGASRHLPLKGKAKTGGRQWSLLRTIMQCGIIKAINRNLRRRTPMKYKGTLIVVKDCNRALKFYRDMFGFQLLQDNDGNMELTNNLYLQELGYWEQFTKRSIISNSNQSELYFEEPDIEQFVERLETLYPETEYVNYLMTHSWGQKVVRFYDPDGNLIEVGTLV